MSTVKEENDVSREADHLRPSRPGTQSQTQGLGQTDLERLTSDFLAAGFGQKSPGQLEGDGGIFLLDFTYETKELSYFFYVIVFSDTLA